MMDRKLRILEVVTVPTEKSGIPNVAFNLMRAIPKENLEIGYVSINEPSELYKTELEQIGAALYVIPRKLSSPWKYVAQLSKIARGYDVIHVHGNSATMVLEMLAAKTAGVKIRAAHSHSTSCRMKVIDAVMRPLFYGLCNVRLACGEASGRWLYGKKDFEIIRNGISTSKFKFDSEARNHIREELDIKNEILLGNIANFEEVKNHTFLIDIFEKMIDRRSDLRLILLGQGPTNDRIKEKVKEMGLTEKVIMPGSVDNPWAYMSAIDYIIMPSLHEGLPLTLVEEQANGLSMHVSTEVSREADLVGRMIFKELKDSPADWAEDILGSLDNLNHNEIVSEKSIESIRYSGYDIEAVGENLIKLFKDKT